MLKYRHNIKKQKSRRADQLTQTHTCSELSSVLPGLPMHFLKHLSVILWNTKHIDCYILSTMLASLAPMSTDLPAEAPVR